MKSITKTTVIMVILSMVLAGCGGLGNKSSSSTSGDNQESGVSNSSQETGAKASDSPKIGLDKNVYEIPSYTAKDGVKIIRASTSLNAADYGVTPSGVIFKTLVDGIEEKSGGKIVLQVYPANQLASGTDQVVSGLASGAFELSEVSAGSWGDYTTAFAALNVPFLYKNINVVHDILDGPIGEAMSKQIYKDCNVVPIGYMELGMRQITNSVKEIHSISDLSGIKIRVQSDPIQIAAFETLGGSIISVPFSELFTALQQKLCEAQENPIHNIASKKFYEVQPYMTLTGHTVTESVVILSGKYWDTLTDEEKGWFEEIGREATEASRKACLEQTNELIQQVKDAGIIVTELTPEEKAAFVEKVKPVWKQAEEIMGSEAWNNLLKAVADAEDKLGN